MEFKIIDVGGPCYLEYRHNSGWKVYRENGKTVMFRDRDAAEAEGLVQFTEYHPSSRIKEDNEGHAL